MPGKPSGCRKTPRWGQPAHDPENSAGEVRDEGAGSYTVKPGDYLNSIAVRFGLEWSALAELNGLQYPYVIHTGQELRLK